MSEPQINIMLGPPGTGKTETCLRMVEHYLAQGVPPDRIGYFAFTRRANIEAKERAMLKFRLASDDLPYFKTLHSLAYSQLGVGRSNLMSNKDYGEVSKWLKVGSFFVQSDEYGIVRDIGMGDKYLELINMARVTQKPLKELYNQSPVRMQLDWQMVDYVDRGLRTYKQRHELYDYTDMLEEFVRRDLSPRLEVLIIDEAQDLSALQWQMVKKLISKARYVHIAGDDDQAIYRWAGADVDQFIRMNGQVSVLNQSYRIPARHHDISQKLIHRVKNRRPKDFLPRDEAGELFWHRHSEQVDLSSGNWLLLARTVRGANQLEEEVRQRGLLYRYDNSLSADSKALRAVVLWEKLRAGARLHVDDVKRAYAYLTLNEGVAFGFKSMPGASPDGFYNMEDLEKDYGLLTRAPWDKALTRISERDRRYLAACMRKGETLTGDPRITISTIHRAKGAQADNVLLVTDVSNRKNLFWKQEDLDDEARVFYVGLTRAKKELHLIQPMFSPGYAVPHG